MTQDEYFTMCNVFMNMMTVSLSQWRAHVLTQENSSREPLKINLFYPFYPYLCHLVLSYFPNIQSWPKSFSFIWSYLTSGMSHSKCIANSYMKQIPGPETGLIPPCVFLLHDIIVIFITHKVRDNPVHKHRIGTVQISLCTPGIVFVNWTALPT